MSAKTVRRVAIIGGGISGLSAAHRLVELEPSIRLTLYEATAQLGGVLRTLRRDEFLIEQGADMFTTREPWALGLCRRVGLADQLLETNPTCRRAFVVSRGRLRRVPDGFTLMSPTRVWPLISTPLLSWRGKLRLALEYFVPARRTSNDESLAAFARRRFGVETYQRLVQPLVGGIYTADPEKLSIQAALPQFPEMERTHGGLIRGARRAARMRAPQKGESGARYGTFRAPLHGMESIARTIEDRLPADCIQLQQPVRSLHATPAGAWRVDLHDGRPGAEYDGVILATPAQVAASQLADCQPQLAAELAAIPYAGVAVAALAYPRHQIRHRLDGFGYVAPACEQRKVLSVSFSSVKFTGRAPPTAVLFRAFLGGACQPEMLDLDDGRLQQLVEAELRELLGAEGRPLFCEIFRWRHSMPQYHLGHLDRVARIGQLAGGLGKFALAGNAYRGVGVPFCVHSGEEAAESLLSQMRGET